MPATTFVILQKRKRHGSKRYIVTLCKHSLNRLRIDALNPQALYLPGFVTLVFRGMPTVWRGRHSSRGKTTSMPLGLGAQPGQGH